MKPFPLALLAILAVGCGSGSGGTAPGGTASGAASRSSAGSAASGAVSAGAPSGESVAALARRTTEVEVPRRIVYKADLVLAAEDLDRAADGLEAKVRGFGGYIGDATRNGTRGDARKATWTIRVPADRFDAFLKGLPSLGEFVSLTREAQDVSEEFYDAAARLKNKRVEEARLVDLLKRVAGNLDQILQVEKELSRIRGEIESIEGRLRLLANLTDLSTVTVTIREVKNYVPEGPPTFATPREPHLDGLDRGALGSRGRGRPARRGARSVGVAARPRGLRDVPRGAASPGTTEDPLVVPTSPRHLIASRASHRERRASGTPSARGPSSPGSPPRPLSGGEERGVELEVVDPRVVGPPLASGARARGPGRLSLARV